MMQLSHHANERLTERDITEAELLELVACGATWRDKSDPAIRYTRLGNLFAVFHGKGNWLITAYRLGE